MHTLATRAQRYIRARSRKTMSAISIALFWLTACMWPDAAQNGYRLNLVLVMLALLIIAACAAYFFMATHNTRIQQYLRAQQRRSLDKCSHGR